MGSKFDIIPDERRFYYNGSQPGNTLDGRSLALAKKTMQGAIDGASALSPNPGATALVKEGQGGFTTESIVLGDSVLFEGTQTSIVTSDPVAVTAANNITFKIQAAIALAPGGVAVLIEDTLSFGCYLDAARAVGNGGIIYDIKGICDDIFIRADQMAIDGIGTIGFNITATSETAIDVNGDTVLIEGTNNTLVDFSPPDADTVLSFDCSTIETTGTNSTGFMIRGGTAIIKSQNLGADIALHAENGSTTVFNVDAIGGDIIADDSCQVTIPASAVLFGNINVNDTSTVQTTIKTIQGNTNVEPGANISIISDQYIGDINIDGGAFLIIGQHIGNLTGAGTPNGIVNGVRYGNWEQKLLIKGSELGDQIPDGKDDPMQIKFGPAQASAGGEVSLSADGALTSHITHKFELGFALQYGRTSAGMTAILFFIIRINGVAAEDPVFAKLPSSQSAVPVEFIGTISLDAGDVLTVELVRDGNGADDGQLIGQTPTLAGLSPAPSARIRLSF